MKKYICAFTLAIAMISMMTISFAEAVEPKYLYEIRIPFEQGAYASASVPDGRTFDLGTVALLPEKTRWPSYTASAWGTPGSVTASAVNAVHILISVEDGKGRTMSVIPKETIAPAAGPGAAIVLDSPGGSGFFGAWAPPIGTKIFIDRGDGELNPLTTSLPQPGDTMVFKVFEDDLPYMIQFENRPGGRVTSWSKSGVETVARVIRPVAGVGRFGGTMFQDSGRIRANHSGVIDVSTCEYGQIGGFQIIPWDHALESKEMQGSWSATQWMIIGPEDGKSMMGGTYPLFNGGLVPGSFAGEELWDMWSTYGRKPLVLARANGGPWQKLPETAGKVDDALKEITHIRIYFPISKEPLTD